MKELVDNKYMGVIFTAFSLCPYIYCLLTLSVAKVVHVCVCVVTRSCDLFCNYVLFEIAQKIGR